MSKNTYLTLAGICSLSAAALHIGVIFGGPDWYRAFGAGEAMAAMAQAGSITPTLITLFITGVLTGWGLYALSGAGVIRRLPLLRSFLCIICGIYCIRGMFGAVLPFISNAPEVQALGISFWLWSSGICLAIGLFHVVGLVQVWPQLSHKH